MTPHGKDILPPGTCLFGVGIDLAVKSFRSKVKLLMHMLLPKE